MVLAQLLAQMKNTREVPEERVDIAGIKIDTSAPVDFRAQEYLNRIKNPYAFKCGDIAVNIRFSPEGKGLKKAFSSYLSAIKKSI